MRVLLSLLVNVAVLTIWLRICVRVAVRRVGNMFVAVVSIGLGLQSTRILGLTSAIHQKPTQIHLRGSRQAHQFLRWAPATTRPLLG